MTSKKIAAVIVAEPDDPRIDSGLPDEVTISLATIAGIAHEGLMAVSAAAGLAVMATMMDAELTSRVGAAKHAKLTERTANWHGTAEGTVVLGGRRVPVERPRGRTSTARRLSSTPIRRLTMRTC